jgi:signal transduction histidine kinase
MTTFVLRPWNRAAIWRSLVHMALDVVAIVPGTLALFLAATALGLLVALPLAVPVAWALAVTSRGFAVIERQRIAALLGTQIDDPVPPLPPGSWWARLKVRLASKPRRLEVAYVLLRVPIGLLAYLGIAVWSYLLALALLPLYVFALPGDSAKLLLLEVGPGPGALLVSFVGIAGIVLVAPRVTLAVADLDRATGTWLLGSPMTELEQRASRAEAGRVAAVDAAEAERSRIERDLHDGAQQRLVALAVDLGAARERMATDPGGAASLVAEAHDEAKAALEDLRHLVRGFHPAILQDRGLDAALSAVVARCPVPVDVSVELELRPPAPVESAAYFVVSETLTNVARHAACRRAAVAIAGTRSSLVIEVRDDGQGGADPARGTGLAGLRDRVVGLGGSLDVLSPAGGPTTVLAVIPCGS